MKVLALDQSSKTSGFAVFEDQTCITFGHFTFEDSDIGVRLTKIKNKVSELIKEYEINYVIFEDIQLQSNVGNNVATFKILAEVYGVLEELMTELNIPHSSVLASVWKSKLGIKGRTRPDQKRAAQAYVLQNYNKKATQDESDAICIGTYFTKEEKEEDTDFDWS